MSIPDCVFHTLRKNHAQVYPRRMIFLDTETKKRVVGQREDHYMKMAWACFVERRGSPRKNTEAWRYFESPLYMWEWIEAHSWDRKALYLFGHNLFFDLQASDFFYHFPRWGWTLDFYHDKGLSYILCIRNGRRSIKCVSTTNFFDFSLEKIGELVGLPKEKVDFDTVDDVALSTYCRRDVEIIKKAMEEYFAFIRIHDLGKFAMTKASQSMNAFRHRFMNEKILIHDHEPSQKLEKESYIGGRCEAFFMGKARDGPFINLDVNSMYPYVMQNNPLPTKLVNYHENPTEAQIRDALKKFAVISECLVQSDRPIYAVRHNKKICFPVGRFVTCLGSGGLALALERGHIVRILRAAVYQRAVLFDDFVDYLYGLRKKYQAEGNAVYVQLLKIFLNSLYGKFAQYIPITDEIDDVGGGGYWREEIYLPDENREELRYKMFNKIVTESGREIGKNSFVAISSEITEYARLALWKIMEPLWPDKILYCDTDAVKLREADLNLLQWPQDKDKLGSLKVTSRFKELEIRGAKSYITEHERVIKGIPKRAVEIAPYTYEFMSFPRQSTHMRERVDRWHMVNKMVRHAEPKYDKGYIEPDGHIRPWVFQPYLPPH